MNDGSMYAVPAKLANYSECLPGKPKPDADYHEGGEVVGHKTGLVGERGDISIIDIMRCKDCGEEWES